MVMIASVSAVPSVARLWPGPKNERCIVAQLHSCTTVERLRSCTVVQWSASLAAMHRNKRLVTDAALTPPSPSHPPKAGRHLEWANAKLANQPTRTVPTEDEAV
jgi:hypothetical protein